MKSAKISQKHDNVSYNRNNYMLKSIHDDENECINYTLSTIESFINRLIDTPLIRSIRSLQVS